MPDTIYCIDRTGAAPVAAAYQHLVEKLQPDTIVLVDGGTDSLMRGDEPMLGTPQEDMASLAAVDAVDVATKLLLCLGFGIDNHHGVCHWYVLGAIAELIKSSGFLGAWTITKEMPEVQLYSDATDWVFNEVFNNPSIVNSSILSAVEVRFGDYHATNRTRGGQLFINALMSIYWGFTVESVARRNLYLDQIRQTETYEDLTSAIEMVRCKLPSRKIWMDLPL